MRWRTGSGSTATRRNQRGAMRSMISEEVRWIPYSVFNSFIAALMVMFIVLVLGSLASYAYARLRFPGRRSTFLFILLSRLIPTVALAVPYYAIVQSLGLLNTRWALIGIYTVLTLPFAYAGAVDAMSKGGDPAVWVALAPQATKVAHRSRLAFGCGWSGVQLSGICSV